jgi:hypothetical protein
MPKLDDESQQSFIVITHDRLDRTGGNVVYESPLNATKVRKNKKGTLRKVVAVKRANQEGEKALASPRQTKARDLGDFILLRTPANCRSAL